MKYLLLISVAMLLAVACNERVELDESLENTSNSTSLRMENEFIPFNLLFPKGTTFDQSGSGVSFTLPSSNYLLGIDSNGSFYRSVAGGTGGVTCTCTKESPGCSPTIIKGKYGIAMSTCSSCDNTGDIVGVDEELTSMIVVDFDNISVIKEFDQLIGKEFLPQEYYASDEFVEILEDINSIIDSPVDNRTMNVFMDIMGYVVMLEVPYDADYNTIMAIGSRSSGTAGITCSNNIPGSDYPKKGNFLAKWCDVSNCKSCSLSGIIINGDGVEKLMSVENGVISIE